MQDFLQRYFQLDHHRTDVRTELIAGATTFLSMVYITVVNPAILSDAGMDFGAVFVATCIAAAVGSLIMGLWANYPIAQAPGMGQNAFFTYGIVLGLGHTWEAALGAVFVSGIIFVILSVLPVREWLINAIPKNLKLGISAGIGLFLGFIALKNAGVVVANPATLVTFGDMAAPGAIICLSWLCFNRRVDGTRCHRRCHYRYAGGDRPWFGRWCSRISRRCCRASIARSGVV